MKKTIMSLVLASISFLTYAQQSESENSYLSKQGSFGVEVYSSSNEFTAELAGYSMDADDDSKGFALQLGAKIGSSDTLTTFIEYRNEGFEEGVYDDQNNNLHYLSLGLLKEFPQASNLSPYIRGSVGFGFMDVDEYTFTDDTATNALGGKLGAGIAYYASNSVKIHGGIDFQYRIWTPIETVYGDIEIDEASVIVGAGISYIF
ncbi:hypothetical protein [Vibrio alfacsensis]|uniref:hypothetical protein n=1 Tax=Vibrio alfacsensis TaxID=1074311 RepID=UPI0040685BDF